MTSEEKLKTIKYLHTAVWIFYNIVIFYMLYAAIMQRFDIKFWIGLCLVLLEGVVLIFNHWKCPLTNVAERYTPDRAANFDIYLPLWLAKHNKEIYTALFLLALLIAVYGMYT